MVVVVDESLSAGRAANAAACVAATTGAAVEGLIAQGGPDASGDEHSGMQWAGCTILAAAAEALAATRAAAAAADSVLVVDMPEAAQSHRVYGDYLAELADTEPEKLACRAVSIIGPRNRVSKLVKKLALLT